MNVLTRHASRGSRRARSVAARRLRGLRPPQEHRRAAAALRDRQSDRAARLQAGADADAGAAARLLQSEFAVAQRLARLLQGPARAPGRRHPHRAGQHHRQGQSSPTRRSAAATTKEDSGVTNFFGKSKVPIMNAAAADRASSPPTSTSSSDGKGSVNRSGSVADQRRRRGDAGAAERQSGGRGQAGDPRQLRDPRTDRRRHRAAGGHPERQHHRLHARSRRRASPMAAAARSPTCSSRVTASRCWTCCCRSECAVPAGVTQRCGGSSYTEAPAPFSSRERNGGNARPPAAPRRRPRVFASWRRSPATTRNAPCATAGHASSRARV